MIYCWVDQHGDWTIPAKQQASKFNVILKQMMKNRFDI